MSLLSEGTFDFDVDHGCAIHEVQVGMNNGYVFVIASALFLVVGSYAVLFSAFLPLSGVSVRPVHEPVSGNV